MTNRFTAALVFAALLSTAAHAADGRLARPSIACQDRVTFAEITAKVLDDDTDGFLARLARADADGDCVLLPQGERVTVIDETEILVHLRRPNGRAYWTGMFAIQQ